MGHKTSALLKIFGTIAIPLTIAVAGIKHFSGIGETANDVFAGTTELNQPTAQNNKTSEKPVQLEPYQEP
jgi:hypothetical protein